MIEQFDGKKNFRPGKISSIKKIKTSAKDIKLFLVSNGFDYDVNIDESGVVSFPVFHGMVPKIVKDAHRILMLYEFIKQEKELFLALHTYPPKNVQTENELVYTGYCRQPVKMYYNDIDDSIKNNNEILYSPCWEECDAKYFSFGINKKGPSIVLFCGKFVYPMYLYNGAAPQICPDGLSISFSKSMD